MPQRARLRAWGRAGYRELVDQAVEAASTRGAYLVLDLHRYRAPTEEHAAFWRDLAAYGDALWWLGRVEENLLARCPDLFAVDMHTMSFSHRRPLYHSR